MRSALNPLQPIVRPREWRRRRREIKALMPALLQGAFLAGAAVLLLLCYVRFGASGMVR